jgi:hypothetical protein
LAWDPDDALAVFTKYPWSRHGIKDKPLGFQFPTATYDGDEIVRLDVRSNVCLGHSDSGLACSQYQKLTLKIEHLQQLSQKPAGRVNYQYQTHDQLTQGHRSKNEIIRSLQVTVIQLLVNVYPDYDVYLLEYQPVSQSRRC